MTEHEKLLKSLVDAYDAGCVQLASAEIQFDDEHPPHPWHEEWLSHVRRVISLPAQSSCPWDVALGDRVMQLEAAGADKLSISAILGLIAFVRDGEGSAAPSTSRGGT